MCIIAIFLAFLALGAAADNTALRQFQLKTDVQPSSANKTWYSDLWLTAYHTGAGLNAAVFQHGRNRSSRASLHPTNVTGSDNLLFDLGTAFPWFLTMLPNTQFYAAWQPVEINVGLVGSGNGNPNVMGFYLNETGLQWNSSGFGGWMVCDWWHGEPQLFFRTQYPASAYPAPESCADVYLCPQYT